MRDNYDNEDCCTAVFTVKQLWIICLKKTRKTVDHDHLDMKKLALFAQGLNIPALDGKRYQSMKRIDQQIYSILCALQNVSEYLLMVQLNLPISSPQGD